MKSHNAGRTVGRSIRAASGLAAQKIYDAVVTWVRGVSPIRSVICIASVFVLSSLLLLPLPRRGAAVATYNASHPDAALVAAHSGIAFLAPSPAATATKPVFEKWASQTLPLSSSLVLGVVLLVALMIGFVALYLNRFDPKLFKSDSQLALLAIIVAMCVLGLKIGGMLLGVNLSTLQFGYISLLCITAATMVITVLLEPYIALIVAALLSLLSTLILGNELSYCLMTYASSLVALLSVSKLRNRGDVLRAGVTLALTNVVLTLLLGEVMSDPASQIGEGCLWAVVAGMLSVALFSIGVAIFERPFGLCTHLGLLELSDPNRPLLQEFCRTCPGTYAHSISVGNLASAAADAIGADSLLCRVGAYYHDIGKLKRAQFFVENQSGDNVHERLNPSLSALIVTAHVKEGIEIAEQAKLPPAIRDLIVQHHGTSLIRYFYHRASEGATSTRTGALEHQFRYPGPKPQTREAAIMMLADCTEAASHVMERPTPARIDEFVQKMIDEKLADGQLNEAPITLQDLASIKAAFVRLLCGMLHSRVEYPELASSKPQPLNGKIGHDEDTASTGNGNREAGEPLFIAALTSEHEPAEAGASVE